jgi:hypothetical protein
MTGVLAAMATSRKPLGLSVSTPGAAATGTTNAHTFPAAVATPSGGSGNYSFAWSLTNTGGTYGQWSFTGQGTASAVLTATIASIIANLSATANLSLTLTDTTTGRTVSFGPVAYSYKAS